MTLEELADAVGLSTSQVSRIETGDREPRLVDLERMAVALKRPLPELLSDTFLSSAEMTTVPKVGIVQAGEFREVIEYDDEDKEYIYEKADAEFPDARQMVFEHQGDSMNAASPPILPGYLLVCVDFDDTGLPLMEGMIVVVERVKKGGLTREWSVKQVELFDDRVEFHPRSTKASHKPIVVPYDGDPADGSTVKVLALLRRLSIEVPKTFRLKGKAKSSTAVHRPRQG